MRPLLQNYNIDISVSRNEKYHEKVYLLPNMKQIKLYFNPKLINAIHEGEKYFLTVLSN